MVSLENFVKSMPPSLSESKVTPSFCFPFKIPDDPTATKQYQQKGTRPEKRRAYYLKKNPSSGILHRSVVMTSSE